MNNLFSTVDRVCSVRPYFVTVITMLSRVRTCGRGVALCPCTCEIGIGFNWRTCCRVLLFDAGEVFMAAKLFTHSCLW